MKKYLKIIIFIALIMVGCSSQTEPSKPELAELVEISWIDMICVDNIHYMRNDSDQDQTVTLGNKVSVVEFNVSDSIHELGYVIKSGDATFLPIGTPIYEVVGYKASSRLAVDLNSHILLYDVYRSEDAAYGRDMLDLDNKVKYITINDDDDGVTVLADIRDPHDVKNIVNTIMNQPLMSRPDDRVGQRYFIEFHLMDASHIKKAYWIETGVVWPDLQLTEAMNTMIMTYLSPDEEITVVDEETARDVNNEVVIEGDQQIDYDQVLKSFYEYCNEVEDSDLRDQRFIDLLEKYQVTVRNARTDIGFSTRWEKPTLDRYNPHKLAEYINEQAIEEPDLYDDEELVEILKWMDSQKLCVATAEGEFWPVVDHVAFAEPCEDYISSEMKQYITIRRNELNIIDEGFKTISIQEWLDHMMSIEYFLLDHPKFIRNMELVDRYDVYSRMLMISSGYHTVENHNETLTYLSEIYPDSMLNKLMEKYQLILLSEDELANSNFRTYGRAEWVYHYIDPATKEYQLSSQELSLRINDETSDDEIRQTFGEPIEYTTQDIEPKNILITRHSTFDYGDLFIGLDFFQRDPEVGKIVEIRCLSPKYSTYRGIRVGDSKEKVVEVYPEAETEGDFSHIVVGHFESIAIRYEDDEVVEIMLDRSYP